ncbi:hypothetical protein IK110_02910 [Candidatus Saccharibacteria bacterium]|nr:hypothetical protein [Candidatus Saccharibacteria bacterium]
MENEVNLAISPKEAEKLHIEAVVPPEVFEAVNQLLAERVSDGGSIVIRQDEIVSLAKKLLKKAGKPFKARDFYDKGWLNFEPYYRQKGWKVVYDKPAYCEDYEPTFAFEPKKKSRSSFF